MMILILFFFGIYYLYKYSTKNYDYFEKINQKIKYVRPLPLVGSNFGMFFKKQPILHIMSDDYNKFRNEK